MTALLSYKLQAQFDNSNGALPGRILVRREREPYVRLYSVCWMWCARGAGGDSLSFHRLRSPSGEGHQSGRSGQRMPSELKLIVALGRKSCDSDEPIKSLRATHKGKKMRRWVVFYQTQNSKNRVKLWKKKWKSNVEKGLEPLRSTRLAPMTASTKGRAGETSLGTRF